MFMFPTVIGITAVATLAPHGPAIAAFFTIVELYGFGSL